MAWLSEHLPNVKTWLVIHILFGYVFVISGFIICFLMLLAYIFIWHFNKSLYRKIVVILAYMHWCQLTFLAQWWSQSECRFYTDTADTIRYIGQEHVMAIMNHKYDIDWMMAWIIAERFKMLGGTKVYGKSSLKMVPLIGWAWTFTESIFLRRDWEADKRIITRDLQHITEYPDNYWVTLLLFCEGTRFTEAKRVDSMRIAREKGLPELKHHLLPRTKGFVHSIHSLKGKMASILDLTIAISVDSPPPKLISVIQGKKCKAEIYARRIPLEDVPTDTDEECAAWLHKHYKEKDDIFDKFHQNGHHFGIGVDGTPPRRCLDLIITLFWVTLLCVPLFYYAIAVLLSGSLYGQLGIVTFVIIGYIGVRAMIAVTDIDRGSAYGNKDNNCNGPKSE